ncbi:SAC3 family protein C-like isoform X1 [Zingiber officinale]|uniref:SAC3 family protein C-like isoform X1 n=1 Tax=Zingiber officinale TaxID=94328 RepID=UPI001C4B8464|nr:SAC3 family protein C-like isoform X1 [Zingiber officinale]
MDRETNRPKKLGFRPSKAPNPSPSSSSPVRLRPREEAKRDSTSSIHERRNPVLDEDEETGSPIFSYLVGTCPDMCPAKERQQRERLRDLSVFERLHGDPSRTSPKLAVKKFCRTMSNAELQEVEIRPLPVLRSTLKYLMNLVDTSDQPFEVVHDFVFDRTRSIRQDLTRQNILDDEAICMYEEMVKFHIESHKKLAMCYTKTDLASLCYLNTEQLMKCLATLFKLYDIHRRSSSLHKNEAEFYSFYVLLHLGGKIPQMQGSSLSLWYRKLTLSILQSNEMRFSMTLIRYSRLGNFKRFFTRLEAEASDLQLCLVEPFLSEIRARAISYVNHSGYKLQPYPLKHLSDVLRIKESELEELCHVCGLETTMDEAGMKTLPVKQTSFSLPKLGLPVHSLSTF